MSEPNASPRKKITLPYLFKKVAEGSPITWLTCYDYPNCLPAGTGRHRDDPGR